MTESHFLNDPSDCRLFTALIEKYLTSDIIDKIFKETAEVYKISSECMRQINYLWKEKKCNFIEYIKYIHNHVFLYVTSFTTSANHDAMNMWNYYGKGGMELTFNKDTLINALRKRLKDTNEFLTEACVTYVRNDITLPDVPIASLSEFKLINNKSDNIFESHKNMLIKHQKATENSETDFCLTPALYSTKNLTIFVETYVKSYLLTFRHLLRTDKKCTDYSNETIFNKIFSDIQSIKDKKYLCDLSLYMLVLSALLKHDTYQHEREYRIVYFKYSLTPDSINPEVKEKYTTKRVPSGEFICPYINLTEFDEKYTSEDESENKNPIEAKELFRSSLTGLTLSPYTKNLPLIKDTYTASLKRFLQGMQFDTNRIKPDFSDHTIRW